VDIFPCSIYLASSKIRCSRRQMVTIAQPGYSVPVSLGACTPESFANTNTMSSPLPAATNTHDRRPNDEAFRKTRQPASPHSVDPSATPSDTPSRIFTLVASQEQTLHPILESVGGGLVPDLDRDFSREFEGYVRGLVRCVICS
jgi:hypothetical protein